MDLAIIVLSLILLMVFAYKGFSLIFIAPVFAVLAAVTSDYASMPVYSELYMTKAAEYIKSYLKERKKCFFADLFQEASPDYIITTFLAILEMCKQKEIHLEQKKLFEPIVVEAI